jgi:hypothetical protein
MAQETGSQNKNTGGMVGFLQKNQIWVIVVAIVILAGGYWLVTRNDDQTSGNTNEQTNNQSNEGQQENNGQNENQNGSTNGAQTGSQNQPTSGNVAATGTLMASDNANRGNYMVDSSSGKIYIATKRDFSSLLNKPVTLQAEGTLNSFKFLGFAESNVSAPEPDQGGTNETGDITATGTLRGSDNLARGNYMVTSGNSKIYLQSVHDYSSWISQEVTLNAEGTLDSFINAKLIKK